MDSDNNIEPQQSTKVQQETPKVELTTYTIDLECYNYQHQHKQVTFTAPRFSNATDAKNYLMKEVEVMATFSNEPGKNSGTYKILSDKRQVLELTFTNVELEICKATIIDPEYIYTKENKAIAREYEDIETARKILDQRDQAAGVRCEKNEQMIKAHRAAVLQAKKDRAAAELAELERQEEELRKKKEEYKTMNASLLK